MKQDLKGRKLLLLGSNPLMEDVIKKAREMGVYTIVTDYNDPEEFPVKKMADEFWMESYSNIEKIVELVKINHISGVYTQFNDSTLPYCQMICEKAGLPFFINAEQVYQISNKKASKELCIKHGIPVSREFHVTEDFFYDDICAIEWPVLTKPTDNSGQRGITICHNLKELKEGYKYAKDNSKEGGVIVEEYMQGDYVVINLTLQNGNLYLSCLADKPVVDEKYSNGMIRLPKGYVMPSRYIDLFYEKEYEKFKSLAEDIGLKNGNWGIECVVRNNDFYVFEMQFRLGGMRHFTFVQEENGIDTLEMHIRFSLTGKFDEYDLSILDNPYFKRVCCSLNVLLNKGTITRIVGIDILDKIPEVRSYVIGHQVGDFVELSGSVFQIFMKISIVAKTSKRFTEVLEIIQENIRVYDENGINMVLKII